MDIIDHLYRDKELILKSPSFDDFIREYKEGRFQGKTWLKHYYDSYKAHPEHYFIKPLMLPNAKNLEDIFSEFAVQYTKHGDRSMYRPHPIHIMDIDRAFFDYEEKEYHWGAVYGNPRQELVNKWLEMWGGDACSLSGVELKDIDHPTKYMVLGTPRNMIGHEWVALVDKKRIKL